MNNIGLVIEREYKTRVFKRSFLLMTFLMPLLFVAISVLPALIMMLSSPSQETIVVLDHTGRYSSLFRDTESYHFVTGERPLGEYKTKTDSSDISAVLEIRQNLLEDPKAISLYSYQTLPEGVETYINGVLSDYLTDQMIESYNIPDFKQRMKEAQVKISVPTFRWGDDGSTSLSSGSVASIFGMALSMFIYIFLLMYGGMVLQSVVEEKKSRIMEVMLSSVRPFQLMMGKIIGVGLVGLTQLFIWVILLTGIMILVPFLVPSMINNTQSIEISSQTMGSFQGELSHTLTAILSLNFVEIVPLLILYFIGGYLFYASILASLGSTVSSDEDAGQLMLPVSLVMILSFYVGMSSFNNPEGTMAFWCSLIPFTSPTVMMSRLSYGVPLWQELLSLILLYGSFVLTTYLGGKIYRVGSLMYGKKPSFKEIWRWMRY